jgi:membrane dipeptidase
MVRALALASLFLALPSAADELDGGAAGYADIFAADLHMHPTMHRAAYPVFQGMPGGKGPNARRATTPGSMLANQIDGAECRKAGMRLVLGSIWPPFSFSPQFTTLDAILRQLRVLRTWAERQSDFAYVLTPEEGQKALHEGRVVLIPHIEGGEMITRPDDVDALYAAGARVVQLVHFDDNELGGAAADQLRRNLLGVTETHHNPLGLTPLGKQVVDRLIQKGIVIDLAHGSDQLITDVLDYTESRQVPLIYSHGGSRELSGSERNLPDELARRIAARGGLIGITLYRTFVSDVPETERWPGYVPGSCDDITAHWKHLVNVVGPEALAVGSDFNGFIRRSPPGGDCPDGIRGTQDLPALWAALEKRGVPRAAFDHTANRMLEIRAKAIALSAR